MRGRRGDWIAKDFMERVYQRNIRMDSRVGNMGGYLDVVSSAVILELFSSALMETEYSFSFIPHRNEVSFHEFEKT